MVEVKFSSESAIRLQIGITITEDLGALVAAVEGEVDAGLAIPAAQADLNVAAI